ncbi:unnamed protein product [Closterium sp. Naga37s-1]|nr:unnamed protein product [Closterium sp. Naga37s-1]
MASPLWRQSSLTTYLPSTAAAFAGSGGFQAEAASMMMRHGAFAAAATLSRFPVPMMTFFDSLDSRSDSDSTNVESNSQAPATGGPGHYVRPVPPLLEVPAESFIDTSADLAGSGDSESLRQSEVRFDAWMDHDAAADVPTPRLPRRRQGYAAAGVRGTAAMAAQTERRGGDASGIAATIGSSGASVALTDASAAVCHSQTRSAVGLPSGSGNELRFASGDGGMEGDGSLGASERAAAAAASSARPGFVRQRATSACLDLSSSNITAGSGDGSGGGDSGEEDFRERSRGGRGGRAGSSLFEEWTDLGGRPPWVAGDSGNTPGRDASTKATETRRPIFHQKTPSGRILQELFDLENGPLDLEFLVSLRTPSRRHYDSPAHSSSARSSPYARCTPTATPPRPPSSLAPSPPAPPASTAAAASDGPTLSDAASASAPLGSAATESAIFSAASSESLAPQDSALASARPAAAAADDCSVDDDDEAAAAAVSAWAAVELVDGSVSPAASVSRGWIASAARSRFISRIASSFNYSSLHGRRSLFGLRAKSSSGNKAGLHDAAWRMLVLQQQKIATMEEEILQLRQRCRVAGLGSDKSRSGGEAVAAAGSSEVDGFVLEDQGGGGASGAVYAGLGQYSVISVHRGLREGAHARGEKTFRNLPQLEMGSDGRDCLGGNDTMSVRIPSTGSSHSTLSWTSHAGRVDSSADNLFSPRFSPRPAVAAMGAAAAAAAAAVGKGLVSSPSAGGMRHGFRAF